MAIQIRRRELLAAAGAVSIAATASACGSGGGSKNSGGAKASANVELPTYKPFDGTTPDLPGDERGLHSVFLKAPTELIQSTDKKPITSGKVTALTQTFATPAPGMSENGYWKRLNEALGGTLEMNIVSADYPPVFATTLASGDLPDLMWVPPNQGLPNIPQMLEKQFTDLTEYLAGDAVLEYPNLAALTPGSWRTAVVNGRIWGAPIPSTPFGQVYLGNPRVWSEVGGFQSSSAEEFLDKCKEIVIPGRRWALESFLPNAFHMFRQWHGCPNGYRVNEDRTLTHQYQTDEFKEALEYAQRVYAAGVFHPDQKAETRDLFENGSLAAYVSVGPRGATDHVASDPDLLAEIMVPFAAVSDRKPTYNMGYGTVGFTPFKKTDDEAKIRELLALVNWLSAPFGTVEYMQKVWGTEGEDYNNVNGSYELTDRGQVEVPGMRSALEIMTAPEGVIYNTVASHSEYVYEQEKKLLELSQVSPVRGLYSDTNSAEGTQLASRISDVINDVIMGRSNMDAYDKALKQWEERGGLKILEEFQEVLPEDVPVTPSNRA